MYDNAVLTCKDFLTIVRGLQRGDCLLYKTGGRRYAAPIEQVYPMEGGNVVIVAPNMFVKCDDTWEELQENQPRHLIFNWVTATCYLLDDGWVCVWTNDGPIYLFPSQNEEPAAVA